MDKKVLSYDIVIIGAGTAGIFAAIELSKIMPGARIAIIEQGSTLDGRVCPAIKNKSSGCVSCQTCSIMRGFGGGGAFSDGKYNFTAEFGGWLTDYISPKILMELIEYADSINISFGATKDKYSTDTHEGRLLEKTALQYDLHVLHASVKHLGTENNKMILGRIFEYLSDRIDIHCNTAVEQIYPGESIFRLESSEIDFECRYVIAAPGRSGAEWFSGQCRRLGLTMINNQVDIGLRLELPSKIFEHISNIVYEAKLLYRTKCYGDTVRTFCMNPRGYVVTENTDGIITVNGHSYSAAEYGSDNTNFALLVSNRFTEPFKEPCKYGKHIASLSNMLGGGVLVQRFGDLVKGMRTNEHRLAQSFVKPTIKATPGDLSLVLPKRHLDNIIEMIYTLDKIAPGTANHDTLLYGVEVKFYSGRLQLSNELETQIPGMYAAGDGAGITRGLSQAAASGILAARSIQKKSCSN